MTVPTPDDGAAGAAECPPDGAGPSAGDAPCCCGTAHPRAGATPAELPGPEDPQAWIRLAYPEPDDPSLIDAPRFTRFDMEVAFMAGRLAALLPT